jgi:hypothetical protein
MEASGIRGGRQTKSEAARHRDIPQAFGFEASVVLVGAALERWGERLRTAWLPRKRKPHRGG